MPQAPETSPASPGVRRAWPFPRRWWLAVALLLLTLAAAWIVSGSMFPIVLMAWLQALLLLPIALAAAMLGLRLTRPLARESAFADAGWPDMARLLMSLATGLGVIALAVLAAGSVHLVDWSVMLFILILAGAAGYRPAREFASAWDRSILRQPLNRSLLVILLAAVPMAMIMIACTYPAGLLWKPNGYDVLEYHLQLPREFLANSSTAPLAHNVYSFFPANMEMLYLMVLSLCRLVFQTTDVLPAVMPATMLHAFFALLSAGAVALAPIKLSSYGRCVAFVTVLAIPMTVTVGSLAFNDAAVLLFGSLAIGLCIGARSRASMLMIGLLLGLAVGCKMTSGVMVALPVAAVLLARGRMLGVTLAAAVALAAYSPWAIRSMAASHTPGHLGNPVFPVAANRLGLGTWTPAQAENFARNHRAKSADTVVDDWKARFQALGDQVFCDPDWSPNYVSLEIWSGNPPAGAINRLTYMLGHIGWLWFVFPVGLAAALSRRKTSWRLLLVLGVQVAAWLLFTHLQSRFFLPAIVPIALLLALGTEKVATIGMLVGAAVGLQALLSGFLFLPELKLFLGPQAPQALFVDGLSNIPEVFRYPDFYLPVDPKTSKSIALPDATTTYLVGDSKALYYHGTVYYHTVWDADPLVEIYKRDGGGAAAAYLRGLHVDYLVVNWSEIDRFRSPGNYGFDPAVTPEMFAQMQKSGLEEVAVNLGAEHVTVFHLN